MPESASRFFPLCRGSRKILILDLGFLGDTIQLIPSLYCIRQALPEAHLSVMVADHIKDILKVCPWVDNILGYPRFPKGPRWYQDFGRVRALRRAGYDAVINLNGSDRSSLLTWLTGAPLRFGRRPERVPPLWTWRYTHWVHVPYGTMPVYRQRWQCLQEAGFPGESPAFGTRIPEDVMSRVGTLLEGEREYIHVSPFTTLDYKELPETHLVDLIAELQEKRGWKVALSCAPNERERGKLDSLLKQLPRRPWKVFAGDLGLLELAGVIQSSQLHLGGDSGAMHVAFMTGVPTVTWFRDYANKVEWMPEGSNSRVVLGQDTPSGLQGVTAAHILTAVDSVMKDARTSRP